VQSRYTPKLLQQSVPNPATDSAISW
jgi:hypothetical protein